MKKTFFALVAAMAACGCVTVRETELPEVVIPHLPAGKAVRLQLAGFEAKQFTYIPSYGFSEVTAFDAPVYCGHGHYYDAGPRTYMVSTTEFIPKVESSASYRNRATDAFEKAGCILQTADPQYRIEVTFEGPFAESGDGWATTGWMLLSVFTAEYGAQTWRARLRLHDVKSGKLVLSQDLSEHYEIVSWGPVPLFSPACDERTSSGRIASLCLTVLTDRAVDETVRFLSGVAK